MKDKPLVLRIESAKQKLINALNEVLAEESLPCFLVEPIIADLHEQVTRSARREYEQAVRQQDEKEKREGGTDDGP